MKVNVFARRESDLEVLWRRWRGVVAAGTAGALVGAAIEYLLDPAGGHKRRLWFRSRFTGSFRHGRRRAARTLRVRAAFARGHAHGLAHRLCHEPASELDDAELAHKVESIVFRDPSVPKGLISINAENGVVFLRGEVESQKLIDEIELKVRDVEGVRETENLLHLPGTPAPHPRGGALLSRAQ
jgi:hypothetical protein